MQKFKYHENVLFQIEFINTVLREIGEKPIDINHQINIEPNGYEAWHSEECITFGIKNNNSAQLIIMCIFDEFRIDIEELSEFRGYSIEDMKKNESQIKNEIKQLFTSTIKMEYYCNDYIIITLLDKNKKKIKTYKYIRGLFVSFYFWLCKCKERIYAPIFPHSHVV